MKPRIRPTQLLGLYRLQITEFVHTGDLLNRNARPVVSLSSHIYTREAADHQAEEILADELVVRVEKVPVDVLYLDRGDDTQDNITTEVKAKE